MIGESLISSFEVLLYRYGWYIVAIFGILILLGGTFLYSQATGDTIGDRFDNVIDVVSGFFSTIIDSVKNGFQNMVDAFKGLIPSMDDIWNNLKNRVDAMIPDLSGIYDYIDEEIDDALSTLSGFKDTIEDTARDVVHDYLIGDVFEPVTGWWGYEWDYSKWIPWNLYYAAEEMIYSVIEDIPGMGYIMENARAIEDFLEDYI
jgi:hypothetical protein